MIIACIFLLVVISIVGTLIAGVQKAKRDGKYLMPDPTEEGEQKNI
jgi:hypothetical protein